MEKQRGPDRKPAAAILALAAVVFSIYTLYFGKDTLPNAPTHVSAEAGDLQAAVSFSKPAGKVESYTVTSYPDGKTATGTSSPILVTGLTNGTEYVFTVVAVNKTGSSPASVESAGVTPMTTPGIPTNLTANTGFDETELIWEAPKSDGGSAVIGYEVSQNGGADYTPALSNTGHTFTGLESGTAYDFCVRALNDAGAGEPASIGATPGSISIPRIVGEKFTDSTGFEWRVLAIADDKALIITEHVHAMNTKYHSEDGFRPFQTAEISQTLNLWYDNDKFVSTELKARALSYAFQLEDGTPGGNGVENQASTWQSNRATTNQRQARTIPGTTTGGDKAFVLSVSELNQYFEDNVAVRAALRVSESGVPGKPAYWWLRSPSTHFEYTQWLVGPDGYVFYDPATHATGHLGLRPALWVLI